MPKNLIKRYMPSPETIREHKSLQFLGDILHEPNLWHLNRHAVAKAFLVGVFCSFIPMPFQMVLAAMIAIRVNCNLPISVALVWISNPITMPPIFYFNYLVGAFCLNQPPMNYEFQLSWAWLSDKLIEVALPLYLGSVICGVFFAGISYVLIQYCWKRKVRKDWHERKKRRAAAQANS